MLKAWQLLPLHFDPDKLDDCQLTCQLTCQIYPADLHIFRPYRQDNVQGTKKSQKCWTRASATLINFDNMYIFIWSIRRSLKMCDWFCEV